MNDLPEDLAHPRDDHSLIANIVVGAVLIALLLGLIAFYFLTQGWQ